MKYLKFFVPLAVSGAAFFGMREFVKNGFLNEFIFRGRSSNALETFVNLDDILFRTFCAVTIPAAVVGIAAYVAMELIDDYMHRRQEQNDIYRNSLRL